MIEEAHAVIESDDLSQGVRGIGHLCWALGDLETCMSRSHGESGEV